VLAATPFHGEGYRKVRARWAHRGQAVSGKRVLRLMRIHQLLAPRRLGLPNGDPSHPGTIITTRPDELWGTDATRFCTEEDGWCWFFGGIDHCVDELVGWQTAKIGDRWAALEPLRQGVRHAFGRFAKDVARGLRIRCDWGPQCIADAWINEVKWLGDDDHGVVCRRAGVQWRHRAVHAHAQGAVPPPLPDSRRGAADHRRVHRAV
jgi:hypothetical protein